MSIPFVDIGIVTRIRCVELGMVPSLLIESDKGVFHAGSEKTFCQSCMYAMEGMTTSKGVLAWGLSRSMSFCGSMAAMERRYDALKVGLDIPLMSDEDGWKFMLEHRFPDFAKGTWRLYEEARWVDVDGREVCAPDWFRPYWARLLYHRQDELGGE